MPTSSPALFAVAGLTLLWLAHRRRARAAAAGPGTAGRNDDDVLMHSDEGAAGEANVTVLGVALSEDINMRDVEVELQQSVAADAGRFAASMLTEILSPSVSGRGGCSHAQLAEAFEKEFNWCLGMFVTCLREDTTARPGHGHEDTWQLAPAGAEAIVCPGHVPRAGAQSRGPCPAGVALALDRSRLEPFGATVRTLLTRSSHGLSRV